MSSDTNVWIDFDAIGEVSLPFLLPYRYIMWEDAVRDELLSPSGLSVKLVEAGLESVSITAGEFYLADDLGQSHRGLSVYDRVALAIAKERDIPLLTGDRLLRKAATEFGVEVMGTIGILDSLLGGGRVTEDAYSRCTAALLEKNSGIVRLPEDELRKRLGCCDE